ncbi:hypothetical protein [Legionella drozanskii]|uniref:Uncharacterized protein n=1 Tax=Legionella drozanskii LLAP-1 TaxID=1212489 RepID=A0A0W0SP61_9GAMM|nr:hypothetical protein [Legionella drozanskii]KTC84789.1 hypothetical protein Ldro_2953 [Legionella drozanskii LLAP-1]
MKLNQPTKSVKKTDTQDLITKATETVETAKKPARKGSSEAHMSVMQRGLSGNEIRQSYRSNSSSLGLFSIQEEEPKNSSVITEESNTINNL